MYNAGFGLAANTIALKLNFTFVGTTNRNVSEDHHFYTLPTYIKYIRVDVINLVLGMQHIEAGLVKTYI